MSAEEDYQKSEFIKLALRRKQEDEQEDQEQASILHQQMSSESSAMRGGAGGYSKIMGLGAESVSEEQKYHGMFKEQMQQYVKEQAKHNLQKEQEQKMQNQIYNDSASSYAVHKESDTRTNVSDSYGFSSSTVQGNGYEIYKREDTMYQMQKSSSIKDTVKRRTVKSVFQDNSNHTIWETIQSEQQDERKAERQFQNRQSEVFKSNKSSHFIKNTAKQTAAVPGKLMKNYVKQAKIAELITSGDIRALVDTSASAAASGIGRTIRKIGRGIKHLCSVMAAIVLKILAPILPYIIVVVVSMIVLYVLIMGYEVDDSNNTAILYSYALANTGQVESTENGSNASGNGNSAPSGIVNTHMSSYIYFNQGDYSDPMGCTSNGVTTIRRSGCGLTALASALATWTGDTSITPRTVLNYGLNGRDGNTCSIVLVSSSLYGGMCEKYGLTYETIVPKDAGKLRAALIDGKSVIVLLSNRAKWSDGNYVTSRTHYIVLMGFAQNGKIACMNPAGGNMKYIDFNTVVNDPGTDTFHVIYSEEKLQQWKQEDSK